MSAIACRSLVGDAWRTSMLSRTPVGALSACGTFALVNRGNDKCNLTVRQQPQLRRFVATTARPSCRTAHSQFAATTLSFWTTPSIWSRSALNTFRCLVGCTIGDMSMMWWLQLTHPELGMATTMALSMGAGITSSVILETTLLHLGRDGLPWRLAAKTAVGMSMISMLAMESAENAVNLALTGGAVDLGSSYFWLAAGASATAGFIVPLPYNYYRLKAFRKACH